MAMCMVCPSGGSVSYFVLDKAIVTNATLVKNIK